MACVMGAYPLLNFIPVAALAGIMLVVVLHTFKWFTIPMILAAFLPKFLRNKLSLQRKVGGVGWDVNTRKFFQQFVSSSYNYQILCDVKQNFCFQVV